MRSLYISLLIADLAEPSNRPSPYPLLPGPLSMLHWLGYPTSPGPLQIRAEGGTGIVGRTLHLSPFVARYRGLERQ